MTEDVEEGGAEALASRRDEAAKALLPDHFLQALVALANLEVKMPVTLTVAGQLISGRIVSGRVFFQHVQDDVVSRMTDGETKGHVTDLVNQYFTAYPSGEALPGGGSPAYIHLVGARYFAPGVHPIPTGKPGLWRGRLADVSGFQFGELSAS